MLDSAADPRSSPRDRITAASWRIVLLASLGGTLEFYDFVIFGIFARDIADAIFPSSSPLVSLMASFAAFAAGYFARPLGGIVLSHYGDRYGRRRVFLWSVFVMSGATLGMGLVPSYGQWGVVASALMVALRIVQGFCLGGELPGALTYVVETAPRIAPFVCAVVFACVTMGVAAATGVSLSLRTLLAPEDVPVLGWRIADRKSTRLNSSHLGISYAVFCLKKKNNINNTIENRPEGEAKWYLEQEQMVKKFYRKMDAEHQLNDIQEAYHHNKEYSVKSEVNR